MYLDFDFLYASHNSSVNYNIPNKEYRGTSCNFKFLDLISVAQSFTAAQRRGQQQQGNQ